jgi:uncharacterized membrane protein YeaQ/YmgE (transglycosylase-associated protein family)
LRQLLLSGDQLLAEGVFAIVRHLGRLGLGNPTVNVAAAQFAGGPRHWHDHCFPDTLRGGSTRMSIITWIVVGLIAGWLASMVMHGGYGIIGDLVLGVLGALIGGWVTGLVLGRDMVTGFNVETLVVAVIGAIVLIAISRLFTGRRASA